jgi:hypothetical protein
MKCTIRIIALTTLVLPGAFAVDQVCDPVRTHMLLPSDGQVEDSFGGSVAVKNGVALIGVVGDDVHGEGSGSVHVYDVATGELITVIAPNDGAPFDRFGVAVAFSETPGSSLAVIGASLDDDRIFDGGSAYVYDLSDPASPQQIAKLVADDGAELDLFGANVALGGAAGNEIAVIGAHGDDDHGVSSGAAYLFDAGTGQELFKLASDDIAAEDIFGDDVAIRGDIAIIGAFGDDHYGDRSGAAYLFDTATGEQLAKLVPDDGGPLDFFGTAVAIGGSAAHPVAVVGAYLDDDNGVSSGSVYVFDIADPENPVQLHKFLPEGDGSSDRLGWAVAMSGQSGSDLVIASARSDFGEDPLFFGSVYLFDTVSGEQLARFNLDDQDNSDFFGWSVAVDGDAAVCGAVDDDENGPHSGSAHVLDLDCGPPCEWDLDGDGDVGTTDLVLIIVAWNQPFDVTDLIELIVNWGPCPD